jgi:AraC-like DNA-binding protein
MRKRTERIQEADSVSISNMPGARRPVLVRGSLRGGHHGANRSCHGESRRDAFRRAIGRLPKWGIQQRRFVEFIGEAGQANIESTIRGRGVSVMFQNGTAPASEANLKSASDLGVVAEQLMDATDRMREGDRRSAQARVARAMASPKAIPRGGLAPWQVRRVTEYIEANLASTIRLEDLARIARLSHSHFCRAFKESLGHPAHAYVMRRRVRRAQGLMLNTAESLSQIAAQCGMADQAHFCKLFRRLVGESPNAWRRAHRQSLNAAA